MNVVVPRLWPIDTIALTCSACGSVVEYLDGLMIMSVTEALREYRTDKEWAVRRHIAFEPAAALDLDKIPSSYTVGRELVLMGLENGLSIDDIAREMSVARESIQDIARSAGVRI